MPIAPPKLYSQVGSVSIYCEDCRTILPKLNREFQLIFADPPFNIGQDYIGYQDRITNTEYEKFTEQWIAVCAGSLLPSGILALHGPDELVEGYLTIPRRCLLSRISWVNWHYRFGQCSRDNWINARCHLLLYQRYLHELVKRGKSYKWNPEEVLVESDRAAVYGDKRVDDYEHGGERLPGTVWGVPSDGPYWGRIQGNNAERREGHPNQLPEVYLERVIRAYTDRLDIVLDPFGGSGTTAVVAAALGRGAVTIDVSEANCASIVERLKRGAVRV